MALNFELIQGKNAGLIPITREETIFITNEPSKLEKVFINIIADKVKKSIDIICKNGEIS